MPAQDMPAAEVEVDVPLVRALLQEQHPDLADLPLEVAANGWDNAMVRIGTDLVARLPRRELSVPLMEHEQRWLPLLAPRLPLPIPEPVRVGRPGAGYPWPWTISRWLPGRSALDAPPADLGAAADALGGFLRSLHVSAPADAPTNRFRGTTLAERSAITTPFLDALADEPDVGDLRSRWEAALALPGWAGEPVWVHGDTHPGNLVVHDGRLAAVVDWGDLCAGDPASDLAVAWMLFDPASRSRFRTAVGGDADPALWDRGRAWALGIAIALRASSADNPAYAALAARTLAEVVAEDD